MAKTILLVSASVAGLSAFRVIERLGKGFRGPPRDAWLSSLADPATRGYSFGVHKALDKAGAVFGPLVANGLLRWLGESTGAYQASFWVAFVPAVLSVLVLALMKGQPGKLHARESVGANWRASGRLRDRKELDIPGPAFVRHLPRRIVRARVRMAG